MGGRRRGSSPRRSCDVGCDSRSSDVFPVLARGSPSPRPCHYWRPPSSPGKRGNRGRRYPSPMVSSSSDSEESCASEDGVVQKAILTTSSKEVLLDSEGNRDGVWSFWSSRGTALADGEQLILVGSNVVADEEEGDVLGKWILAPDALLVGLGRVSSEIAMEVPVPIACCEEGQVCCASSPLLPDLAAKAFHLGAVLSASGDGGDAVGVTQQIPCVLVRSQSPSLLAETVVNILQVPDVEGGVVGGGMVSEEGQVSPVAREALRLQPADGLRQPPLSPVEPVCHAPTRLGSGS
ncbi:hypothetical protein Dimus_013487 [Dionaea muscipula]